MQVDACPAPVACLRLQRLRGTQRQVVRPGLHPGITAHRKRQTIFRLFQGQLVRQLHRLHEHIHQVVAVLPLAYDIQGPVDFRPCHYMHDIPPSPACYDTRFGKESQRRQDFPPARRMHI